MTYVALANLTLTGNATNVSFTSIPATFRDLVLVVTRFTSTSANVGWTLNNDTSNNYHQVFMRGLGSGSGTSGANANVGSLYIDVGFSTSTESLNHIVQILDYSATDKHKTVLSTEFRAGQNTAAIASRWANTAAVNRIDIGGNTMIAGSTFALYGIRS